MTDLSEQEMRACIRSCIRSARRANTVDPDGTMTCLSARALLPALDHLLKEMDAGASPREVEGCCIMFAAALLSCCIDNRQPETAAADTFRILAELNAKFAHYNAVRAAAREPQGEPH